MSWRGVPCHRHPPSHVLWDGEVCHITTATPSHETQVRGVYQVTTTLPLAFREILDYEKALTYASFIRPPMHVEMQYKTGSDPPLVVFVCVQNGEGYPPLVFETGSLSTSSVYFFFSRLQLCISGV